MKNITDFGNKWNGIINVVRNIVYVLITLLGSGTIIRDLYTIKELQYSFPVQFEINNEYANVINIKNTGKGNLTELQVIISNLESAILSFEMPGPHETVNIVQGGVGFKNVTLDMPRMSEGKELILVLTTSKPLVFSSDNMAITSNETSATPDNDKSSYLELIFFTTGFFGSLTLSELIRYIQKRRKNTSENESFQRLIDELSK